MARGYPDWAPVQGVVSSDVAVALAVAAGTDIIASPGAGFRILLRGIYSMHTGAAGGVTIDERTSANVFVRTVFKSTAVAGSPGFAQYEGLPFAPNNKLRVSTVTAPNPDVIAVYSIIPA